ncbi:MAG: hypothetical protein OXC54_08635 [Rhodospirillaceae bacterium]|nr:hypothetical protein [Rhodospirillaceae bacterium]
MGKKILRWPPGCSTKAIGREFIAARERQRSTEPEPGERSAREDDGVARGGAA